MPVLFRSTFILWTTQQAGCEAAAQCDQVSRAPAASQVWSPPSSRDRLDIEIWFQAEIAPIIEKLDFMDILSWLSIAFIMKSLIKLFLNSAEIVFNSSERSIWKTGYLMGSSSRPNLRLAPGFWIRLNGHDLDISWTLCRYSIKVTFTNEKTIYLT